MAEPGAPSRARNFFGGLVDRVLPGSQYNRQTGQYSNVGRGVFGRLASIGGSLYGGPAVGALVNNVAGQWVDRRGLFGGGQPATPDAVVRQPIGNPGISLSTQNLGFGKPAFTPGYIPQVGNFGVGNNYVAPGPSLYQSWNPQSGWGADQLAQQPTSPFDPLSPSARAAADQANGQNNTSTAGNGLGANASAQLMLANMDRMQQQAQEAMNSRYRRTA